MRAANVPALAAAVLGCAFTVCAYTRVQADPEGGDVALGFASSFGAAAPALIGDGSAQLVNPAALAQIRRRAVWSTAGTFNQGERVSVGALQPTANGVVLGVGYTRARVDAPAVGFGTRRQRVHLGTAWSATHTWSLGANVQLLSHEDESNLDTSFGLDLGARWAWGQRRQRPAVVAAVGLRNAVEPRVALSGPATHEPQTWTAALAWNAWRGRSWSTTLAGGVEAPRNGRRALSYVARAEAPYGLSLALGVHDARLRAGAAVSNGAWTLGYTRSEGRDGAAHGLNVQLRFGPEPTAQRRADPRTHELDSASQFVSLLEQRDRKQLLQWRRAAASALERSEFERAASLYRVLLEVAPGDVQATDGLLRAQHGARLREAEVLLQQRDRAGAVRALEGAIALAPDDSVSIRRLRELQLAARDANRTRTEVSRHFNAGIDAYARQDYRAAIAAFDAVLALDPQHLEAASYREQAVNSHDVRVRSALNQSRTRLEAGDFEGARLHVRRAVEMDPDDSQAQQLSANIERAAAASRREAQRQQQAQLASQAAVNGEDAAPRLPIADIRTRYDSGMQQYRSGDLMTAMQTWEEVASLAPHFEEVDKYLLRVYRVTGLESYTEGRLRDAVDIWEKALELEPENPQLRRYLNRAHAKLERAQSVDPRR